MSNKLKEKFRYIVSNENIKDFEKKKEELKKSIEKAAQAYLKEYPVVVSEETISAFEKAKPIKLNNKGLMDEIGVLPGLDEQKVQYSWTANTEPIDLVNKHIPEPVQYTGTTVAVSSNSNEPSNNFYDPFAGKRIIDEKDAVFLKPKDVEHGVMINIENLVDDLVERYVPKNATMEDRYELYDEIYDIIYKHKIEC